MTTKEPRIVLITGASSGIGRAAAEALARKGFRVYGTSRRPVTAPDADLMEGKHAPGFLRMIPLDVRQDASVEAAVETVLKAEGRIDILINNAGYAHAGAIEETSSQEALDQMDTNFFGMFRMCRQVIPVMRRQKNGLIINVGSVMGLIALPFQSMYSASKYAMEAFTESMRMELAPLGIKAVIVEPGDTRTGFKEAREFAAAAKESAYGDRFTRSIEKMAKDEQNGPGPEVVVRVILRLIDRKNPPVRVAAGPINKCFALLKKLLPSRLGEFVIKQIY